MKKVIALGIFLVGGSLLFLVSTLSGCQKSRLYFLKSVVLAPACQATDSLAMPFEGAGDTCRFPDLYFVLQCEGTLIAQATSGIGNRVHAFQFPEPDYINVDKIKEIHLITLYPYNQFPAGSDATELIHDPEKLKQTLNEKLTRKASTSLQLHTIFMLHIPPDELSRQQFVLELISENNTVLRDTTAMFYIQP